MKVSKNSLLSLFSPFLFYFEDKRKLNTSFGRTRSEIERNKLRTIFNKRWTTRLDGSPDEQTFLMNHGIVNFRNRLVASFMVQAISFTIAISFTVFKSVSYLSQQPFVRTKQLLNITSESISTSRITLIHDRSFPSHQSRVPSSVARSLCRPLAVFNKSLSLSSANTAPLS